MTTIEEHIKYTQIEDLLLAEGEKYLLKLDKRARELSGDDFALRTRLYGYGYLLNGILEETPALRFKMMAEKESRAGRVFSPAGYAAGFVAGVISTLPLGKISMSLLTGVAGGFTSCSERRSNTRPEVPYFTSIAEWEMEQENTRFLTL